MAKVSTKGTDYAERLTRLSGAKWKKVINAQLPYRWNLTRLKLGKTLDVGCGIGRNLGNLSKDSVGVDHNKHAIKIAQNKGYNAFTVDEFKNQKEFKKNSFESMLFAHVLEHLTIDESKGILKEYLPYVSDKVVIICPQEKGYTTDSTHVTFLNHKDIEQLLESLGLTIEKSYSFPFMRNAGKIFTYNETVVVARKNK